METGNEIIAMNNKTLMAVETDLYNWDESSDLVVYIYISRPDLEHTSRSSPLRKVPLKYENIYAGGFF